MTMAFRGQQRVEVLLRNNLEICQTIFEDLQTKLGKKIRDNLLLCKEKDDIV